MKSSKLVARICEDYTESQTVSIKKEDTFVIMIFSFGTGDIITYRIDRKFYEDQLRGIFQVDVAKDKFFNFRS